MQNTIKDFLFGSGVLKKLAGETEKKEAPAQDTSYIQNIVKQRMAEKMAPKKNPLADEIQKTAKPKALIPVKQDPNCKY